MKTRDSGMPGEALWESFFDAPQILGALGLTRDSGNVVEIGCGYGTFTLPAARIVRGTVYAYDIEAPMVARTLARARAEGLANVRAIARDVVESGTGLDEGAAGYAMLFNLLHAEERMALLAECHRVLRPGGVLAVIHWNYDPNTPRGPALDIRPRPDQCRGWAMQAGFAPRAIEPIPLPPYHYGWTFVKPA